MRSYILRKVKGKHGCIIIIIVSGTSILLDFSEHIFLGFLLIDSFHYILCMHYFHYFLCYYKILVYLTFPTVDLFHCTSKNPTSTFFNRTIFPQFSSISIIFQEGNNMLYLDEKNKSRILKQIKCIIQHNVRLRGISKAEIAKFQKRYNAFVDSTVFPQFSSRRYQSPPVSPFD